MTDRRPAIVALLIASLALTGCAELFEFSVSSPAASAGPSAEPPDQSTPAPAPSPGADGRSASGAMIPTDCRALVSQEVYEATFGGVPLNDPGFIDAGKVGVLQPTEPPEGATVQEIIASQTRLGASGEIPRPTSPTCGRASRSSTRTSEGSSCGSGRTRASPAIRGTAGCAAS